MSRRGQAASSLSPPVRAVATLMAAAAVALVVIAFSNAADRRLRVEVLDTAGGSATVMRAPGGEIALIGCGSQPDRLLAALGRVLPATQRGIDLLLLPGQSSRMVGGAAGLAARYTVKAAVAVGGVSATERALLQTLAGGGTEVMMSTGESFAWAGLSVAPIPVGGPEARDAAVLIAASAGRTLILGDLDLASQEELAAITPTPLRAELVVAPSRGGVALSLLAAAGPRLVAVPSSGSGTAVDHTAWAGAQVARTSSDGDLTYVGDPQLRRDGAGSS